MSADRITIARQSLLESRARHMRFHATASEHVLWQAIRGRQLGVAFRRQVPVGGRFIVDFFAASVRLVVELDGGYHAARVKADARRDEALRRLGCRVSHLEAELILRELPVALERIAAAIRSV